MKLFKYVIVAAVFIVEKSMATPCLSSEMWDARTSACVKCPFGLDCPSITKDTPFYRPTKPPGKKPSGKTRPKH